MTQSGKGESSRNSRRWPMPRRLEINSAAAATNPSAEEQIKAADEPESRLLSRDDSDRWWKITTISRPKPKCNLLTRYRRSGILWISSHPRIVEPVSALLEI